MVVGYKTDAGTFEPLPADWFSIKAHPELAEYLRPKGKITVKGDVLTSTLDKPRRLRKVRLVVQRFPRQRPSPSSGRDHRRRRQADRPGCRRTLAGPAPGRAADRPGDRSPSATTTSTGSTRTTRSSPRPSTAPTTTARSPWPRRSSPAPPTSGSTEYLEAKRCRVGDQLIVIVTDYDEDTTDDRDTVPVKVTTSSGETLTLKALETQVNGGDVEHDHAGEFLAVLQVGDKTRRTRSR